LKSPRTPDVELFLESILRMLWVRVSRRLMTEKVASFTFDNVYDSDKQCEHNEVHAFQNTPSPKISRSIAPMDGKSGHSRNERRHFELILSSQSVMGSVNFAPMVPTRRWMI
jgi:hypothetical protein